MTRVIGYKGTEQTRQKNWIEMYEHKRNYEYFRNRDISIAEIDKNRYNYYLNQYVQEGVH
jgi:hypothetical protein